MCDPWQLAQCQQRLQQARKLIYIYAPYTHRAIWVKFVVRNNHINILRICGFRENPFKDFYLRAYTKLHLLAYRQTVWQAESKEFLGKVCVLRLQLCSYLLLSVLTHNMTHSNSTCPPPSAVHEAVVSTGRDRQLQCIRQWSFVVVIGNCSAFGSDLLWSWSASTVHAAVVSRGRDL